MVTQGRVQLVLSEYFWPSCRKPHRSRLVNVSALRLSWLGHAMRKHPCNTPHGHTARPSGEQSHWRVPAAFIREVVAQFNTKGTCTRNALNRTCFEDQQAQGHNLAISTAPDLLAHLHPAGPGTCNIRMNSPSCASKAEAHNQCLEKIWVSP